MTTRLFTDYGYISMNHIGEVLCGDYVTVTRLPNDSMVMVLADGMGSGVKANILATLTSTMMSKMVGNEMDISDCIQTVITTLPVSKDFGVSYATFSVVYVRENRWIQIYNYDNPTPFVIRNRKLWQPEYTVSQIHGKRIESCSFEAEVNDSVFMMSDGVLYAGIGATLNYGWGLPEITRFAESIFEDSLSAKSLATYLIDRSNNLYYGKPTDDVTCAVLKIRESRQVNVMVGPSTNRDNDDKMVSRFLSGEGKHVVCGGTTASIVARYLGKDIEAVNNDMPDEGIPPISQIEGIDLVTEGMITLNRVLEYARDFADKNSDYFSWNYKNDGASLLSSILLEEATDINFFMGCAINPAHQANSSLNISLKMKLMDELVEVLQSVNKNVMVTYY
ncbi:MAG: serine/threonine-protein phosphatase [Erysipelotrichaceae bacterium]|nr:serine/threonine-protein phosphatase [Erysipelotrichaceae bacterium]